MCEPDLEPTEPATLLAAVKTAEATSKVLQAKLASVDVGGSLSPAVVQKLAGAVVRTRPALARGAAVTPFVRPC